MMTRYSIPANTADYCPTDSDYCYDPVPYEPTQDDMGEWTSWLMDQVASEPEPLDLTDEAYAAHRAAVLARWGSDEAPF